MVKRPHRVEGVSRMPRACIHSSTRLFDRGIRMTDADAYPSLCCFGNYFSRAVQFRSNRHHSHMAARRLPQLFESRDAGRNQIFRRMYAPFVMTQEWTLKVNSNRPGSTVIFLDVFYSIRQPL